MDDFAHRTGVQYSIQKFRQRKEKKRVEKAMQLRKYKKIMKQEGYEPGKGARRKREIEGSPADASSSGGHDNEKEERSVKQPELREDHADREAETLLPQRRKKTNPLQKAAAQAKQRKQEIQDSQLKKEQHLKERQRKLHERKQRTKRLSQRTKKGQPIMKNIVHDILEKLR